MSHLPPALSVRSLRHSCICYFIVVKQIPYVCELKFAPMHSGVNFSTLPNIPTLAV